jgi:hypothetical protein
MFLAEKTVKNMVASMLMKLGMARGTEVAELVIGALNRPEVSACAGYRSGRSPDWSLKSPLPWRTAPARTAQGRRQPCVPALRPGSPLPLTRPGRSRWGMARC